MEGKLPSFPIFKLIMIFQFDNFLSKFRLLPASKLEEKENAESLNRFLRPFKIRWGISFVSLAGLQATSFLFCLYLYFYSGGVFSLRSFKRLITDRWSLTNTVGIFYHQRIGWLLCPFQQRQCLWCYCCFSKALTRGSMSITKARPHKGHPCLRNFQRAWNLHSSAN